MRHVIVGGGTAALYCITTLRQLEPERSEVVLIAQELPYSRMVLPYYLGGEIAEGQVYTLEPERLAALGVEVIPVPAAGLDTTAKRVLLADGRAVEYDDLLIATGSSAVRPPIPGADGPHIYNQWTLADTNGLLPELRPGAAVTVVGAGFIAFTILNALVARGVTLTVVEAMPHVLPRMVDAECAGLVEAWLRGRGVTVHTGARLTAIEPNPDGGPAVRLLMQTGAPILAHAVVMATGIRPNLDWLQGSGLAINRGIVVDEHLRTSAPGVYAAGDVAEGPERISGEPAVHAIQPTAMEHGRIVGAAMAGQSRCYHGSLLMNIVDVLGLEIASFGHWDRTGGETTVGIVGERPLYRRYNWEGDRIVGAITLGPSGDVWMTNDIGMLKGIVQNGTRLGPMKAHLQRDPFDLKRAFVATQTTASLLPETLLGRPTAPTLPVGRAAS